MNSVPYSQKSITEISDYQFPFFLCSIQAGFPSPADGYIESMITLNELCISNPSTTFFGKVVGKSLEDIYIYEGDILVIDKSIKPMNKDLVVCILDGEFNAKIFYRDKNNCIQLLSANPDFKPMIITQCMDFKVWGVITFVIQNIKKRAHVRNY